MTSVSNYFQEPDWGKAHGMVPSILKEKFAARKLTAKFKKVFQKAKNDPVQTVNLVEKFRVAVLQLPQSQKKIVQWVKGTSKAQKVFNKVLTDYKTSLMFAACYAGHIELVKLLVEGNQVSLDIRDKKGAYSLLHYAIAQGHEELAVWLVKNGAPLEAKEGNLDRTPLHFACEFGRRKVVSALLVAGANLNAKDRNGFSPLHDAIYYGHEELAVLLIKKGASLEAKQELGRTPLHLACEFGRKQVFAALVAAGADLNAEDGEGYSPLHLACCAMHEKRDPAIRAWLAIRLGALGASPDPVIVDSIKINPTDYLRKQTLNKSLFRYPDSSQIVPFPRDVWIKIFSFVPNKELVQTTLLVCKTFHNLVTDALLINFNSLDT